MKILLFAFLFLFNFSLHSQAPKGLERKNFKKRFKSYLYNMDSINHYLPELKKIYSDNKDLYLELFYYELNAEKFSVLVSTDNNNLDSLIYYYNKAISFGKENEILVVNAISSLAYEHIAVCKVEDALKYTADIQKYYNETKLLRAKTDYLSNLAIVYAYCLNKYDSAIHYYNQTLIIKRESQDSVGIAVDLENIGLAYIELQELETSLPYLEEALEIEKSIKSLEGEFFCKTQLAVVYNNTGRSELSKEYLLESIKYYEKTNNKIQISDCARILSNTYVSLGDYDNANKYIEMALSIYSSEDNTPGLLTILETKSRILYEIGNYEECAVVINTAISKNKTNNVLIWDKRLYDILYRCESKLGNYEKAFFALKKFNFLADSLKSNEQILNLKEVEEKYENEKKDQELKLLKANQVIESQKQNRKSNLLTGGIVLTSIVGLLLFFLFRNRQKTSNKLKEIDTIKTRFFENISHEFRTPLTLIKLPLSQAINNEEKLELNELNLMHNNASRLQNLIEDLLSLSELEAGKMKIKKSEQDPLLQAKTLCSQFDSYAESKGINYHKVIERNSVKATYDKSVVDKVLGNLISNAIKYSETGGEVQVSITMVDQKLVMKVSDKGEGISPEDQEKIFERFYRVGDTDEGKQGSGIGLALVKKLIEINNGTIDVTSKINEGSTFTATIPLENIVQLPYEPLPEIEVDKKRVPKTKENLLNVAELSDKPKLLITEDNKELLEYISSLFKDDFQLINAVDGEDGMKKALEFVPDFIISDWMMPNKNGLEFCADVKTNTVTSHIPFLLLTAKSMVEDKIEGYETGADAYFSKPFNFNELKARVDSLLKQRQLLYDKFSSSDVQLSSATNNSLDVEFWNKFKSFLKQNIKNSDLSAIQFTEHLGLSRMQLHRKLNALTGKNLSAIIKNQRMNLATELLKDKSLRISDVCFEIGFEDSSAFGRAFKKEFGLTPTQYRKNEIKT